MPRNTLVGLPLQSRGALVRRYPILSLTVVVLYVTIETPTCHCKEMSGLDPSYQTTRPGSKGSCVEQTKGPHVRPNNHAGDARYQETRKASLAQLSISTNSGLSSVNLQGQVVGTDWKPLFHAYLPCYLQFPLPVCVVLVKSSPSPRRAVIKAGPITVEHSVLILMDEWPKPSPECLSISGVLGTKMLALLHEV